MPDSSVSFGPPFVCQSPFYALIKFRLAGVPFNSPIVVAVLVVDFLFAYLPRFNQPTHTHSHTHIFTLLTVSHKGLNHPTLSCLAFTRILLNRGSSLSLSSLLVTRLFLLPTYSM